MSTLLTHSSEAIQKARTGIDGFDEITGGGLPRKRTTAIYGGPGSGKTIFAIECLVHAATEDGEPGVIVSFAEDARAIVEDATSVGFNLRELQASGKIAIDSARVDVLEVTNSGGYTLDGLRARIEHAVDRIGAKRVVIDGINVLAEAVPDAAMVRAELRSLLDALKAKGVTTIVTVEITDDHMIRVEEYLADCVVHLRLSLEQSVATRRLRVLKYRGSAHRMNEYAFLISSQGVTVKPVTGVGFDYPSSDERISTGIPALDAMLAGGFYRGDSVLIAGSPGAGKSTLAASMAQAACASGERCLYLGLEEPASQIIRNMRSVGFDLARWTEADLLSIQALRPGPEGLEPYLSFVTEHVEEFDPRLVVIDPLTSLKVMGNTDDIRTTLVRLLGLLKSRGITCVCTMIASEFDLSQHNTFVTTLVDSVILLQNIEQAGERNRTITILKSRGIPHSKQVREFQMSSHGVELADVFAGPEGVAVGTARLTLEAALQSEEVQRLAEAEDRRGALEATRRAMEARIAQIRAEFAIHEIQTQGLLRKSDAIEASAGVGRESVREARESPENDSRDDQNTR